MNYKEAIKIASTELNIDEKFLDKVYKAYWRSIKEHIESLPLKDNLTEGEFNKLRPCVNVPSIGKFYVTYNRYKKIKKYYEDYKSKKNTANI